MSTNPSRWRLAPANRDEAAELARECAIPMLTAYLCVSRGLVTPDEVQAFVCANPELTADPFTLPDMEAAVVRLTAALDSGEQIAVFGDYDTDGVCAAALLTRYLEARGGFVTARLPDRKREGYGITPGAVEELHAGGVTLIVTADNGISAYEAAEKAREFGVDLIITDHHSPGEEMPHAIAIVNAKRLDCTAPYRDYCGTGTAFLLACALEGGSHRLQPNAADEDNPGNAFDDTVTDMLLEEFGDLLALSTIGDVVPLTGENRALVRRGLAVLNNSPCPGLAALIEAAGLSGHTISAHDVAFRLSPRINAAGRMGSADVALKLLLADDEDEALALAQKLCQANTERQETEKQILNEALSSLSPKNKYDPVLLLSGKDWHEGIIGIAAAKAAERYGRPAFVLSISDGKAKGSARSFEGFHIHKALTSCADLLQYYGGHAMAGGLTMASENIEALRTRLNEYAAEQDMPYPTLTVDARLTPAAIKPDLLDAIAMAAPFGCGNEEPLFALTGLTLKSIMPMGEGRHLRLSLEKAGTAGNAFTAALFFTKPSAFAFAPGDTVDIAVTLSENYYRGERKLSVVIKGIRPASVRQDWLMQALRRYNEFRRGNTQVLQNADIPDRDFCGKVYKALRKNPNGWDDIAALCVHIGDDGTHALAVRFTLDILCEAGLLEDAGDGSCRFPHIDGKRDLNATSTMQTLVNIEA
ncbi:MAG: single-stranded-DNA-specific exonuclease RecJ [Oscillospiraceae bacterium]|jgi:single-stranded-DNA-specific exonuclease|nr:single-stranded-DNA-specific exonuclease RecJ [Oscillospiraceae bacterium]